ncbi:MAG: hypothetical protein JWO81_2706 [Alphaproteobacteria bacterium]|nr:hypothetical protein [Alphaproteobacteria bacterium]
MNQKPGFLAEARALAVVALRRLRCPRLTLAHSEVRSEGRARLVIFLLWLAVALFLAWHHVMWRDEVRAYSLALTGNSVADMLRAVHGEGHPALWYLVLRGLHTWVPDPRILPFAGLAFGAAASLLFALRAPFRWPFVALALFGRFALYEYTVVARNYGISMLILFAIAALYPRYRDKGWVIGGLLLLLCNTNLHSVVFAASLLLFWTIELAAEGTLGWTRPTRALLAGALMTAAGAVFCFIEIYPPFNDAAPLAASGQPILSAALQAIPAIGDGYGALLLDNLLPETVRRTATMILVPLLLYGCLLRFAARPGALLAAAAGLLGLLFVFTFVYRGYYRHEALILPFLLTLAWLSAEGRGGHWPARYSRPSIAVTLGRIGAGALIALLVFQVGLSSVMVVRALIGRPASRSFEAAQLLRRPGLRDAIAIGDPDYVLEALPYYVPNPTYFVRERRYGRYWVMSRRAMRIMTPGDMLETALSLRARTGRPVVILMSDPIFRAARPGERMRKNYGLFRQSSGDIARFMAATCRIASFGRVSGGDETYDVFVLRPPLAKGRSPGAISGIRPAPPGDCLLPAAPPGPP